MGGHRLTPRQRRFVEEYVRDGNATRAAVRAGFQPGSAYRLAHDTAIAEAIEEALAAEQERLQGVRRQLEGEMERLAFADGSLLAVDELAGLPPEVRGLVDVSVTESPRGRTVHYRLPGRLAAMSALSRHSSAMLRPLEMMEEEECYAEDSGAESADESRGEIGETPAIIQRTAYPPYRGE